MTRPVLLRRAADAEFQEAVAWYDRRALGKGAELAPAVRDILTRVAGQPDFYPIAYGDLREAKTPNFPYCVYYREESDGVIVVGVVHASRDPSVWQGRL